MEIQYSFRALHAGPKPTYFRGPIRHSVWTRGMPIGCPPGFCRYGALVKYCVKGGSTRWKSIAPWALKSVPCEQRCRYREPWDQVIVIVIVIYLIMGYDIGMSKLEICGPKAQFLTRSIGINLSETAIDRGVLGGIHRYLVYQVGSILALS